MAWMLTMSPAALKLHAIGETVTAVVKCITQEPTGSWVGPVMVGDIFKPATDDSAILFTQIAGDRNYLCLTGYSYDLLQMTEHLVASFRINADGVVPLVTRQDVIRGVMAMCDAAEPVDGLPEYTFAYKAGDFIGMLMTAYAEGHDDGYAASRGKPS